MYCGSSEELVAVDLPWAIPCRHLLRRKALPAAHVKQEKPDVIVNIVDAANLSRSLFFTTQLLELGIPVVVALNKSDIAEKKGTKIDIKLLSERLGCPVIPTVSVSAGHKGLGEVIQTAVSLRQRAESTLCAGRY